MPDQKKLELPIFFAHFEEEILHVHCFQQIAARYCWDTATVHRFLE
jgi:hypothetical protein